MRTHYLQDDDRYGNEQQPKGGGGAAPRRGVGSDRENSEEPVMQMSLSHYRPILTVNYLMETWGGSTEGRRRRCASASTASWTRCCAPASSSLSTAPTGPLHSSS